MKARFGGQCAVCHQNFAHMEEIVDSGLRGPRGGKKMAHPGCVSKARANGTMIPLDWEPMRYAPDPKLVNWTAYPQFSYDQYARENVGLKPKAHRGSRKKGLQRGMKEDEIVACESCRRPFRREELWDGFDCLGCAHEKMEDLPTRSNPSLATMVSHPWPTTKLGGGFYPQIFPYGTGGRPASYGPAKANPRKVRRNPLTRDEMFELRRLEDRFYEFGDKEAGKKAKALRDRIAKGNPRRNTYMMLHEDGRPVLEHDRGPHGWRTRPASVRLERPVKLGDFVALYEAEVQQTRDYEVKQVASSQSAGVLQRVSSAKANRRARSRR